MKIEFVGSDMSLIQKDFITKTVTKCEHEFFPPLSTRRGTTEKCLASGNQVEVCGIEAYINALFAQSNIFALNDVGVIIGFMSFIHNRDDEPIFSNLGYGINNYISTIIVDKNCRHLGIATMLYDFMETKLPKAVQSDFVSTRTWQENDHHIRLLKKRGYELVHVIENDREYAGKIANTVFYVKKVKN